VGLLQAVAVGGVNLVFTVAAMLVIDRAGRRKLMLAGSIGYVLSLAATAWAFYRYGTEFTATGSAIVLVSLLVFIASHAFGQGAVIWCSSARSSPTAFGLAARRWGPSRTGPWPR
jgi:hypothetical protein